MRRKFCCTGSASHSSKSSKPSASSDRMAMLMQSAILILFYICRSQGSLDLAHMPPE